MKHLFLLTFILFSLGQLGRISFYGQQINVYAFELLLLWVLLALGVKYKLAPFRGAEKKFLFTFVFLFFILFSFIISISEFQLFENFVALLYIVRLLLYFGYFFYLSYHNKKKPHFKSVIRKGLLIVIVLTIITSGLQYFLYPNLRNLLYLGWDPHLYRLFGLFFDSSVAAGIYGLLFIYLLSSDSLKTPFRYAPVFILFVFLILTFSRISYVAFLVTLLIFFAFKKKYKELFVLVALFILGVTIVPKPFGESINLQRTFSIESRLNDYKNAIQLWQKKPLFGYGYNRIRYVKNKLNVGDGNNLDISHSGASFHASYLIILVSAGIIGLIFFVLSLTQYASISAMSKIYLIFLVILSFGDNIMLHPFILFLFFNLISLDS